MTPVSCCLASGYVRNHLLGCYVVGACLTLPVGYAAYRKNVSMLTAADRDALRERWSAGSRVYHDLRHLDECLAHWAEYSGLARHPEAVEAAIWLHDAVYDPHADDNEAASAALARELLHRNGVAPEDIALVEAMILATRHAGLSADPDTQLLCDIDLAILGAPPARFEEYELGVRAEYAWVPEPIYRSTRAAILTRFLLRPSLYQRAELAARYESRARENLTASIARLKSSGGPRA